MSSGQIRLPSWVIVALIAITIIVVIVVFSISVGLVIIIGFSIQGQEISELRQLLKDTHASCNQSIHNLELKYNKTMHSSFDGGMTLCTG